MQLTMMVIFGWPALPQDVLNHTAVDMIEHALYQARLKGGQREVNIWTVVAFVLFAHHYATVWHRSYCGSSL